MSDNFPPPDEALFLAHLPVNPWPFVRVLDEHLDRGGDITDPKSRRLVWVLLAIYHGGCGHVDLAGIADASVEGVPADQAAKCFLATGPLDSEDDRTRDLHVNTIIVACHGPEGELSMTAEWGKLYEEFAKNTVTNEETDH